MVSDDGRQVAQHHDLPYAGHGVRLAVIEMRDGAAQHRARPQRRNL
jgi:hypothetical protein